MVTSRPQLASSRMCVRPSASNEGPAELAVAEGYNARWWAVMRTCVMIHTYACESDPVGTAYGRSGRVCLDCLATTPRSLLGASPSCAATDGRGADPVGDAAQCGRGRGDAGGWCRRKKDKESEGQEGRTRGRSSHLTTTSEIDHRPLRPRPRASHFCLQISSILHFENAVFVAEVGKYALGLHNLPPFVSLGGCKEWARRWKPGAKARARRRGTRM
ncbi:hypothetical protein V8E36_002626 [Tilletia maclaganii]